MRINPFFIIYLLIFQFVLIIPALHALQCFVLETHCVDESCVKEKPDEISVEEVDSSDCNEYKQIRQGMADRIKGVLKVQGEYLLLIGNTTAEELYNVTVEFDQFLKERFNVESNIAAVQEANNIDTFLPVADSRKRAVDDPFCYIAQLHVAIKLATGIYWTNFFSRGCVITIGGARSTRISSVASKNQIVTVSGVTSSCLKDRCNLDVTSAKKARSGADAVIKSDGILSQVFISVVAWMMRIWIVK